MIHFFEGFWWPNTVPGGHVDNTESLCSLDLGPATTSTFVVAGSGFLTFSNSSSRRMRGAYDAIIPVRPKLSLGMRFAVNTSSTNVGGASLTPVKNASFPFSSDTSYSSAFGPGLLPTFQVNQAVDANVSLRNGHMSSDILFIEYLPGHNYSAVNYYEAVYDFEANKIEVYVNNVLIGTLPYVFTEQQKNTELRIVQALSQYYNSSTSNTKSTLYSVVVADEKTGPLRVNAKFATSDAQIDPSFGAGPHFQNVNYSSDGTRKISTTESLSKAMFASSQAASGQILGVNFRGRFSTLEQSALEALGAAKLTLAYNAQQAQRDPLSIPKMSWTKDYWYLPTSPFSGAQWTAAELNAMTFGAEIVVDPKPV